jgi:WD40 repeat protein
MAVRSVAFSSDGKRLASASMDGTVKLWDTATGHETRTLAGHTGGVFTVVFSADGKRLASASLDQTVKVWDARTGHVTLTLKYQANLVWSLAFSPDSQRLAAVSRDATVTIWDATTGQETLTLKAPTNRNSSVAFSPDSTRLASVNDEGTVIVSDTATGLETLKLGGHPHRYDLRLISPIKNISEIPIIGKNMIIVAAVDKVSSYSNVLFFRIFDINGTMVVAWDELHNKPTEESLQIEDLRKQLTGLWPPHELIGIEKGRVITAVTKIVGYVKRYPVNGVAFSADGKRLASASDDGSVKVWDAGTGQETHTLRGHTMSVRRVAFGPDGKRIAAASMDGTVKLWDTATGQETLTLYDYTGDYGVFGVEFSSDGNRLVSERSDGTVRVWDARPLNYRPANLVQSQR